MTAEQHEDIRRIRGDLRRTLDRQREQPAYAADADITARRLAALDALLAERDQAVADAALLGSTYQWAWSSELRERVKLYAAERDLQAAGGEDGDG